MGGSPVLTTIIVTLSPSSVQVSQTTTASAAGLDQNGRPIATSVTWSSTNTSVATIAQTGVATAVAPGQAELVATAAGRQGQAVLTVVAVPVSTVSVSAPSSSVVVGGTLQLSVTLRDATNNVLTGRAVAWSSSNPAVAAVSATGLVSGVAAGGPVSITATSEGRTGTFQVTVVAAPANRTYTAVTAGAYHTCGLTTTGAAFCWGQSEFGQLGDNSISSWMTSPVAVLGGLTFSSIAAGDFHTCGITTNGALYCWGLNDRGQLGDGTNTDRKLPTRVSGNLTFSSVTASGKSQLGSHTCALTTTGSAYCWGYNNAGQLGDGTNTARNSPAPVLGGLTFTSLSARGFYTCGLTAAGIAYCWGQNDSGQLGDGTTTSKSVPNAVGGGLTFATVNAGTDHACGVTRTGAGYCWGANFLYGQLGDGTQTQRLSPVAVSGGIVFADINAGDSHTCGWTANGVAYCWGDNFFGQVGDESNTVRFTPVRVSGGLSFAAVSTAGGGKLGRFGASGHSCGVTRTGEAYCWGKNDLGAVGDGTRTNRNAPVRTG